MLAFNRTILELKSVQTPVATPRKRTFNRTILELKLIDDFCREFADHAFNRTILELKSKEWLDVGVVNSF